MHIRHGDFCRRLFGAVGACIVLTSFGRVPWVNDEPRPGSFPLVAMGAPAPIIYSAADFKVVAIAVHDLAADIERVTGRLPIIATAARKDDGPLVVVGTLGHSAIIDELAGTAELKDVAERLRGAWESFVIAVVHDPRRGDSPTLIIMGSDRRGTAFGAYELSQAIGVSPWYWWADVTPLHHDALYVEGSTRQFGPPSVKYRGIFLNDEDWGLAPWAAKTFEPEHGSIGPKTYAKVFELMLRLKANTVWPAMHACTKPFNSFPDNKRLADDYAIVMGSSHAEPMLRDNVGEWVDAPERYNYVTNREGVRRYWEQRVRENGAYENIYTLGMRGVHDSGIQGAHSDAERIRILEQVFADQRRMLAGLTTRGAASQQMFCAYKEVLGLYHQGLKVPDDVTIVWPDDNFGYVRNFATADEQKRAGGFGVYYHLSYLGAPLAYLWLYSTPPALVWEEMRKAYDYGARTIWIANVGDLKPAEIGTEFFLQLAWDVHAWDRESLPQFLRTWAAREFGAERADEIASILNRYYRLNFRRKPEHLQWWQPNQPPQPSPWPRGDIEQRLDELAKLRVEVERLAATLPVKKQDAFFELVRYPVVGTALANQRYFWAERAALAPSGSSDRESFAMRATSAHVELQRITRRYNEEIAGGKWRGIMNLEPADRQWRSFRIAPWAIPVFADFSRTGNAAAVEPRSGHTIVSFDAGHFGSKRAGSSDAWGVVPGLGLTGNAVTLFPTTAAALETDALAEHAARLDYPWRNTGSVAVTASICLVPTQPTRPVGGLRFALSVDREPPQPVNLSVRDGSVEWAQGVLDNSRAISKSLGVYAPGEHVFHIFGIDPGVVIDKITLDLQASEQPQALPSQANP